MSLKSPSLFWRTFTLLMLLLIITALAWLQSFRVLSEVPFSKGVSQQIISTVNLTRYALISSDPGSRPDLLHILAYREGEYIIDGIAVDSGCRGERLGEKLLSLAVEEVRKRDGKKIYLVARAPGFFMTQGFKIISGEDAPLFYECATCPQYKVDCFPEIMSLEV